MTSPGETELTVIVLQWGHADETVLCLEALRASREVTFHTIVVNNRSRDADAVATVRAAHPWVEIMENGSNLGFAGGNNVALRHLLRLREDRQAGRYAMLLNNDVIVEPDCIAAMLHVARDKDAAIVGALNLVKGTGVVGSSGGRILWPSATYVEEGDTALARGEREREVDCASGSTFLCDLDVLQDVGVLDEAYFCVYEEADLCARVRATGGSVWLALAARVEHGVGVSTGRQLHFYFRFRNRVRFARQQGRPGAVARLLPSLAWDVLKKCAIGLVLLRPGEMVGVVRGAWHGLRGVTGPGPYVS